MNLVLVLLPSPPVCIQVSLAFCLYVLNYPEIAIVLG